jgi:hypothetical protein
MATVTPLMRKRKEDDILSYESKKSFEEGTVRSVVSKEESVAYRGSALLLPLLCPKSHGWRALRQRRSPETRVRGSGEDGLFLKLCQRF